MFAIKCFRLHKKYTVTKQIAADYAAGRCFRLHKKYTVTKLEVGGGVN